MKQYIEAKIEGEWCTIDRMDITETATFTIDKFELRVAKYSNAGRRVMS